MKNYEQKIFIHQYLGQRMQVGYLKGCVNPFLVVNRDFDTLVMFYSVTIFYKVTEPFTECMVNEFH